MQTQGRENNPVFIYTHCTQWARVAFPQKTKLPETSLAWLPLHCGSLLVFTGSNKYFVLCGVCRGFSKIGHNSAPSHMLFRSVTLPLPIKQASLINPPSLRIWAALEMCLTKEMQQSMFRDFQGNVRRHLSASRKFILWVPHLRRLLLRTQLPGCEKLRPHGQAQAHAPVSGPS